MADSTIGAALAAVANVRETWWRFMVANFSDFGLYSYVFWVIIVGGYLIGGGFFALIDYFNLFPQYKIQPKRTPLGADYWRCLVRLFFNYTVIIFPLSFLNYPALKWVGIESGLPLPPWQEVAGHLFLFLLMEDLLHYIFHRMLHIPFLYKAIHKVHHHHKYPFGFTAAYAHPAEVLLLAIPTYSGPLLFAPHLSTVYLWIMMRELDSVDTHSGYHFPFHPSNFIPFWGASRFHDYHHEVFNCNYASRFTYLDILLGTYSQREEKEDPVAKKKLLRGKEPKAKTRKVQ